LGSTQVLTLTRFGRVSGFCAEVGRHSVPTCVKLQSHRSTGTECRSTKGKHLRELIEVGLLDASWLEKLPRELAQRLKQLPQTLGGEAG